MVGDRFPAFVRGLRSGMLFMGASSLVLSGMTLGSYEAVAAKKKPQQNSGFFSFFDAPPPPKRPHRVYSRRPEGGTPTDTNSKAAKPATAELAIKGPLVITVSLGQQRLTVHDAAGPIAEAPISSGTAAYPTLQGVFTILEKSVVHHSNLYAGAPMPNMQRITWSGTAMHAGQLPGYPASHGCIRLPYNFSKKLYGMTKLGTRVIVTRDPITPVQIAHNNLIAPLPPESPVLAAAQAEQPAKSYETVRSLALISTASAAPVETAAVPQQPLTGYRAKRAAEKKSTEDALAAAQTAKAEAEQRAKDAVISADEAKAAAKLVNTEAQRLAQELKKAEQARIDGDRALEAFGKRYATDRALPAEEQAKAAEMERQLEDKTFDLGRNLEAAQAAAAAAKAKADESNAAVAAAVAKVKTEANGLSKVNQDIKSALASLDSFKRQEKVRSHPVSVFISRSAKRLYVRQGYEPIFDVPVDIKDPEVAIGTHVFTALALNGPTDMRWSAATIPYNPAPAAAKKKKKGPVDAATVSTHLPQTPQEALDRIAIPEDARERIADVMKVGSSIVISDYGISHQTGLFTDFIILTR